MTDKPKARAERLAVELEIRRQDQRCAAAELDRLTEARPDMLRSADDDALEAHDRAMARATRKIERAAALEIDLEAELQIALADEDRATRAAGYAKAKAAHDEYQRLVEREYPSAARKLASVLAKMAEQHALSAAANDTLPEGSSPLYPNLFRQEPEPPSPARFHMVPRTYWTDTTGARIEGPGVLVNGKPPGGFFQHTEMVREALPIIWAAPRPSRAPIEWAITLPGIRHDDADFWSGAAA